MRVYEIARELKVSNKELIAKIRAIGLEVNNHMSSLDADDVTRLKRSLERDRLSKTETKRLSSTVLRRRSKSGDGRRRVVAGEPEAEAPRQASAPAMESRPAAKPVVRRRPAVRRPAEEPAPAAPTSSPRAEARAPSTQTPQTPSPTAAAEAANRPAVTASEAPAPAAQAPVTRTKEPVTAPAAEAAKPAIDGRTDESPGVTAAAETAAAPAVAAPARDTAAEAMSDAASRAGNEAVAKAVDRASEGQAAAQPAAIEDQGSADVARTTEASQQAEAPRDRTAADRAETTAADSSTGAAAEPAAAAAGDAAKSDASPESPAVTAEATAGDASSQTAASDAPAAGSPAAAPDATDGSTDGTTDGSTDGSMDGSMTARTPKTPVVIAGPPVVLLPGQEPPPAPPQVQASQPASDEPRTERRRPPRRQSHVETEADKRTTLKDVATQARSNFEEELERARARVIAREESDRKRREDEERKLRESRPDRPVPGTVINLPKQRIKITERAPTPRTQTIPGQGQIRGRFANQRGRPGGPGRKGRDFGRKRQPKKPGKSTQITTPAEHKRVIRMEETIAIPDLAKSMGVKANEVLKKLWSMGMVGVNINASIDHETAQILATEFGYEVQNVAFKEDDVFVAEPDKEDDLEVRSPVVTVMGHVDHGKTSLLDYIRTARVAAGEAGGITQHVAAYKVSAGADYGDVVFLDTPGHEAFTEMRARGAQATDIVVLVVAANDGIMPQTVEALNHAKDAKVAIIVAVNKCDLPDANPGQVRTQLAEHGLIPEEWGGDTIYVDVSALKGDGIPELLESISLTAEILELRANPTKPAVGMVIEAKLDRNRGPMATVLIQEGTLRTGQTVVAGRYFGKVRAMLNDLGKPIKDAGPSTPIELLGLDGVPDAGETLNVADDEKTAKQVVDHRRQQYRKRELASTGKISLENLMERIQEGETHELKVVLKADVQGSTEALKAALIKQSTEKVKVNVISDGVGGITETDVNLAKAGGAIILGFHVRPAGKSSKLAEKEGVEIQLYNVIYEALEDVRKAMAGLLDPIKREEVTGKLEVRETFTIPRVGTVAGCMCTDGRISRRSFLRVIRDSVQVYEGRVGSLRRFKEDVSEVERGYECGLMVQGYNDIKVGDVVEAYDIVEEAAEL